MTDFKIEKGIPAPCVKGPGTPRLGILRALAAADIGDSVLLTGGDKAAVYASIVSAAGKGWAAQRREGAGIRVWKIAEPLSDERAARR